MLHLEWLLFLVWIRLFFIRKGCFFWIDLMNILVISTWNIILLALHCSNTIIFSSTIITWPRCSSVSCSMIIFSERRVNVSRIKMIREKLGVYLLVILLSVQSRRCAWIVACVVHRKEGVLMCWWLSILNYFLLRGVHLILHIAWHSILIALIQ